ncbi:MAG TPA: PIN domain-containing protein [Bryobacteraceae bacterium]|jgi:predicted nucleic acid-binding protein|nr:PIN domain-containing protein [Bryobacteraceae bacterium]
MAPKIKRHSRSRIGKPRSEAYLDTSALIAFLDKSDSYHALFKRLFASPPPLVTSPLVIAEGHGWFLRRYDRNRAAQFLAFIAILPALTVHTLDAAELSKARQILSKFGDQDLTLADAHGLAIMRDRRSEICWSTDRHLGLTGAKLAIKA